MRAGLFPGCLAWALPFPRGLGGCFFPEGPLDTLVEVGLAVAGTAVEPSVPVPEGSTATSSRRCFRGVGTLATEERLLASRSLRRDRVGVGSGKGVVVDVTCLVVEGGGDPDPGKGTVVEFGLVLAVRVVIRTGIAVGFGLVFVVGGFSGTGLVSRLCSPPALVFPRSFRSETPFWFPTKITFPHQHLDRRDYGVTKVYCSDALRSTQLTKRAS